MENVDLLYILSFEQRVSQKLRSFAAASIHRDPIRFRIFTSKVIRKVGKTVRMSSASGVYECRCVYTSVLVPRLLRTVRVDGGPWAPGHAA